MTKLLLIEDDTSIVRSLTEFLQGEGFWVQNAPGQKKALQLLEQQPFDLALARMIVSAQNGTIKAENASEQGARFLVRFYKGR